MLDRHHIKPEHRAKIVDWIIKTLRKHNLSSSQTFFIAISILDRYLMIKQGLTKHDLHLLALGAIFVASKYEDPIAIPMDHLT
jgi:hypothetical protein